MQHRPNELNQSSRTRPAPAAADEKHIVDVLIEERAPRLAASPAWPVLGPLLRLMLGYRRARAMADAIAPLSGAAALAYVSNLLALRVETRGLDHVPARGRCVLVSNHPTGIADGVAMYDALHRRRPDLRFFANADAHRVCAGFADVLVPVAWPAAKRTLQSAKETLRQARRALQAEAAVAIFAAGQLSRRIDGTLQDPPWEHSAIALARKHHAPVIPVHMAGPFPRLFHLFDQVSNELRDITLFHELLNKTGGAYTLTFGAPVDAEASGESSARFTERLKIYVEDALPADPSTVFR